MAIKAVIRGTPKLSAKISGENKITASFKNVTLEFGDKPVYSGEYEVTPKAFEGTVLSTANKAMEKDVRVLEIPHYEVTNETGNTLYIG